MPKVVLFNQKGSQVGELELSEYVYGCPEHQQAIFDTVIAEQAAKRQGTQKAKTRSEPRSFKHCLFSNYHLALSACGHSTSLNSWFGLPAASIHVARNRQPCFASESFLNTSLHLLVRHSLRLVRRSPS